MSPTAVRRVSLVLIMLAATLGPSLAHMPPPPAEHEGACGSYDDAGNLAQASQNLLVASLISVPLQDNFLLLEDSGDLIYNLNVQPVIPFNLSEDWNLITRTIVPLFAVENAPTGFDSGGRGDINPSLVFSPAKPGRLIWGAGPILSFPTATDDLFGSGKWCAGPVAVALTMHGRWGVGAPANHRWSYAGDDDQRSINAFLVQPFINDNLDKGWFQTAAPIITFDWKADGGERWTVPLGGRIGRVFPIATSP